MCENLRSFSQSEYTRVLDNHNGSQLSNAKCVRLLMEHCASYSQANNGAYIYLHHGAHLIKKQRGSQEKYNIVLDKFKGYLLSNMECIHYLESLGFSHGQAKNAVYNYRKANNLIHR